MAARCVYKLISKTVSLSPNTAYSPKISSISNDKRQTRSCSQPPQKQPLPGQENFYQIRTVSRSLESLRDEYIADNRTDTLEPDLSYRDPAREFKDKPELEERNEEGNPIYELAESSRSQENFYDVLKYMKQAEMNKINNMFLHLQPSNIKPYGSNENLYFPMFQKTKKIKIVYPVKKTASHSELKKKKSDKVQYKEYSTKVAEKEYPGYEETKKVTICESKNDIHKKNYSTTSIKKKTLNKLPPKVISTSIKRTSSNIFLKKKKSSENDTEPHSQKIYTSKVHKTARISSKELLIQHANFRRHYNTQNKPLDACTNYVTVKLNELKEECRKDNRCRPRKISFGRLPKITPPDCPCFEDVPLKPGKPLGRLKKRPVKEPPHCVKECLCPTPRADANYKIRPKKLPQIQMQDCPCEEREMIDLIIKRLPKKKVTEPPRICPTCENPGDCCPPRADDAILVEKKKLPVLEINQCPCFEEPPLKDIPLKKLKKVHVEEPKRVCPEDDKCEEQIRADYGLKIERKVLREIKGECPCPVPPKYMDAKPLVRLKKVKLEEKPKVIKEVVCDKTSRADKDWQLSKKRLPKFVPQECPCIEAVIPEGEVKLKRLQPKPVKEKPKVCPTKEKCEPRADDGMVIKRKSLKPIELQDCPCIAVEMKDNPPLKRLVPKPVKEKPKVCKVSESCTTPRSDENLKIEKKTLPVLPPGNCPCVEKEIPTKAKPLPKLKKKPVSQERHCPIEKKCIVERADQNYKVKIRKLPKLQVNDCPCVEQEPPEDVPLPRLKKVKVPEPQRVCKKEDVCEDMPRADKDDWLYWRCVEVKAQEKENRTSKQNKRKYSTYGTTKRYYSTIKKEIDQILKLKYQVPMTFENKVNNIIIDIKPSVPLILTQKPLDLKNTDAVKAIDSITMVICKSNNFGSTLSLKDGSGDLPCVFKKRNRYISTCTSLCEYSGSKDRLKDYVTPSCECPPHNAHLQPRNPIIPEKEHFIDPYPKDEVLYETARKGRRYCRTRKDEEDIHSKELTEECMTAEEKFCPEECEPEECQDAEKADDEKKLTMWEKIVNYFKARPNCPSPEEFKMMRLREEAERAAQKAGLCLYDPKELLQKSQKDLPKVITAPPSFCPKEQQHCEK